MVSWQTMILIAKHMNFPIYWFPLVTIAEVGQMSSAANCLIALVRITVTVALAPKILAISVTVDR
jgi:hypothetical protein